MFELFIQKDDVLFINNYLFSLLVISFDWFGTLNIYNFIFTLIYVGVLGFTSPFNALASVLNF